MEPEVREQFDEIKAILRESAEIGRQIDLRMDRAEKRMAKHDERMQKLDERMAKHDERMTTHDERMAHYDHMLDATGKLVRGGINFVTKKQSETYAKLAFMAASVNKLAKSQQAFVDSLKKGNGNGRKHPKI